MDNEPPNQSVSREELESTTDEGAEETRRRKFGWRQLCCCQKLDGESLIIGNNPNRALPNSYYVVLMLPTACTHNTDTEQRAIQCTFAKTGAHEISAVPPHGIRPHAMAPRGYYMLFILNAKGVPSEGKFIHLH